MTVLITEITEILRKSVLELDKLYKLTKRIQLLEKDDVRNSLEISKLLQDVKSLSQTAHFQPELKLRYEEWITEYSVTIENNLLRLKRGFGEELSGILATKGIKLAGNYPDLVAGIFTIEVNFQTGISEIWYGPKQESLAQCKLEANQIANTLSKFQDLLAGRQFEEKTFLGRVYEAYTRVLRKKQSLEEQAEIIAVLDELVFLQQDIKFRTNPSKANFKEYTRVFFSYDLFRLKERNLDNKMLQLSTAARLQTANKSGFLWIPSNENGNGSYFGFISFKEANRGTNT